MRMLMTLGLAVALAGCGSRPFAPTSNNYKVWVFAYGTDCTVKTGVERLTVPDGAIIEWEVIGPSVSDNCEGDTLEVGPFTASDGSMCDVKDEPGGSNRKKVKKAKKKDKDTEICKYTVKVGKKGQQDPELEMY
jgi:hypothetical protein